MRLKVKEERETSFTHGGAREARSGLSMAFLNSLLLVSIESMKDRLVYYINNIYL